MRDPLSVHASGRAGRPATRYDVGKNRQADAAKASRKSQTGWRSPPGTPDHLIRAETVCHRTRYVAQRRSGSGATPYVVAARNVSEFRAALGE